MFLDIRMENSHGQSINLALSFRGREALKAIGLEDILVKRHGTCMRGRLLHDKDGNLKEILYDSVKGNVRFCSFLSFEFLNYRNAFCIHTCNFACLACVNFLFCSAFTPLIGDISTRFYWMVCFFFLVSKQIWIEIIYFNA